MYAHNIYYKASQKEVLTNLKLCYSKFRVREYKNSIINIVFISFLITLVYILYMLYF